MKSGSPSCGSYVPESAMAQHPNCGRGRIITRRDISALLSRNDGFGLRNATYALKESSNLGATWSSGTQDASPIAAYMTMGSLGLNTTSSREIIARATLNWVSPYWTEALIGWMGYQYNSVTPYQSNYSISWDVAAAAAKSSSQYAIAYRPYEYENRCSKGVVLASYDPSRGWNKREARYPGTATTFFSEGEGVSVAYDPSSTLYIAAVAGPANDYITLMAWSSVSGERVWLEELPYATHHTPAIACNSESYAGAHKCMVIWADRGAIPSVKYQMFDFANYGIRAERWSSPRTFNRIAEYAPTLTSLPSTSTPFMLGLQQGDGFWVWRYSSSSWNFGNEVNVLWRPGQGMLNPTLGTNYNKVIIRYVPL